MQGRSFGFNKGIFLVSHYPHLKSLFFMYKYMNKVFQKKCNAHREVKTPDSLREGSMGKPRLPDSYNILKNT